MGHPRLVSFSYHQEENNHEIHERHEHIMRGAPGIVIGQWLWAVVGLELILLAAVWFARFDPSREGLRRPS